MVARLAEMEGAAEEQLKCSRSWWIARMIVVAVVAVNTFVKTQILVRT